MGKPCSLRDLTGAPGDPAGSRVSPYPTPQKGINTIFDHFRDKPARFLFAIL